MPLALITAGGGRCPQISDECLRAIRFLALCRDTGCVDDFTLHLGEERADHVQTRIGDHVEEEHGKCQSQDEAAQCGSLARSSCCRFWAPTACAAEPGNKLLLDF